MQTDPERQKREIDAVNIGIGFRVAPSNLRYKTSVQDTLEKMNVKSPLRSETDKVSPSLHGQEPRQVFSSYSLSDDSAVRVQNFPDYPIMFRKGPPAAGYTMPGPIFDWIKRVLTQGVNKHGGEKQLEYAIKDNTGVEQCDWCYKLVARYEMNRHLKEVDCRTNTTYKFPKMPHPDGSGMAYYCPVGCGLFQERFQLVWHLAARASHSEELLKRFGLSKPILHM